MYNVHKNKSKKTCKSTINIYLKTINPYDIIKTQTAIDCKKQNIYKCKAVEMQMTIKVVLRHDRITGLKKAAETARNISREAVKP